MNISTGLVAICASESDPGMWTVVLNGIVIVFLALLLIVCILSITAAIKKAMSKKEEKETVSAEPAETVNTEVTEPETVEDEGVTVAVITAALMAYFKDDPAKSNFYVKSFRRISNPDVVRKKNYVTLSGGEE